MDSTSDIIFYLVKSSTSLWNSIVKDIENNWAELYLTETTDKQKNFQKFINYLNHYMKKILILKIQFKIL